MPELEEVIATMEEARESHVQWRDYWLELPCKGECDDCVRFAASIGDVDHQQKWVENYDAVLRILYALRDGADND